MSCSAKKNTASSRFWQSFVSRYNIYYNGHQAFIEGEKAKIDGHKDDYTELLPVFLVGSEKSRTSGKSNYETAITKCQKAIQLHSIKRKPKVSPSKRNTPKMKAYLQRKEFNPFLKKAWMLMGVSQFEKGEFFEAAATFSYVARLYAAETDVAADARQWLARSYAQAGWFYDAEDALTKMRRDSVPPRVAKEADATQADLLLRQERFADALPYLQRTARNTKKSFLKARLYFLLGQVNRHLGNTQEAYKSLAKCIKQSPPYEMAFNARILQTEVAAGDARMAKKMIAKLGRMAKADNNKDYLDQVFYAQGNIYLTQRDTANAIAAYERGRSKSKRTGVEKGVLLLRLAGLYWDKRKFADAQKCYTEALGMIDKTREGYEEATHRSKVLDKLVPYTEAVYLQDSLQALSRMDEKSRNAAIDRVIAAVKKKEEEERKQKADSAAKARAEANGNDNTAQNNNSSKTATNTAASRAQQASKTWYFYNPTLVMQGKEDFKKHWGNRKNADNWRRSNLTVLASEGHEEYDYAAEDSISAARDSVARQEEIADSLANQKLAPEDDPHERAYYLKQIPFTEEARAASDAIIMDGLYNAGVIEKDDLEDLPLAAQTLERLVANYTSYENIADAYYQLFLLYSRWGKTDRASEMKNRLAASYPDDERTRLITSPDYELLARHGKEIEDSLYAATYKAYRERDNYKVEQNYLRSTEKFPSGLNRPKFIFVHALSRLGTADTKEIAEELRNLVKDFPESDVSPMAGMIVKGLESGRTIGSGTFDLGSLWSRRTAESDAATAEAAKGRELTAKRDEPFVFVMAYPTDSLDGNRLLYEMAHFNFSSFVVRGFDMETVHESGLSQLRVSGFNDYDEAHAYAQRVFKDKNLLPFLEKCRVLLISKSNLDLLGVSVSFNDYQKFFDTNFAPETPAETPTEEPAPPVEQHYEDEYTPEELERIRKSGESKTTDDEDDGEWYSD